MPTYTVRDPTTKRTVTLTGDSPPTEQELTDIFAKLGPAAPAKPSGLRATMRERALANVGLPATATDAEIMAAADRSRRQADTEKGEIAPAVLGGIGGVVGGVPGAAVGGALGKGWGQAIQRSQGDPTVPSSLREQAKDVAISGAVQGALQGTGDLAVAGAGKLGKWLMNRATTRVTARLMQDFPELNDTLIDNALTVSQGGYEKALRLLRVAKGKATAALGVAEAAGKEVPVMLTPEIADSLKTAIIENAVKSGRVPVPLNAPVSVATERLPAATKQLLADIDAAADGGTFALKPRQADILKTQLQKESRALYMNRVAPNGQKAMAAEATLKADYATRLNDAIEGIASGYKGGNVEAQPLIGAVRGLRQAIRPSGNLYQAMVRPGIGAAIGAATGSREGGTAGSAAGAVMGAAAMSPLGMSVGAIGLSHPVVQALLQQLPRGLAAAIATQLGPERVPPTIER